MTDKPTYEELEQRVQALGLALGRQKRSARADNFRYRDTLDNIMEGCQLLGFDWRFLYVNQVAAKHGKTTCDQLVGQKITEAYPGIEESELFKKMRHCMERRKHSHLENEFTYQDGSKAWFELNIVPVPEGLLILSIDISDRKRAEAQVIEKQKRLIEAQRLARLGDFTWDVATGEVTWSEALFELLGYDKSEPIDYTAVNRQIHHPDDLEDVTDWLRQCIESGEEELTPKEYRILHKNGHAIQIRTVGRIQRREDGSVKIFATVQDISDARRTENALRDSEASYRNLFMYSPDAVIVNIKDRVALVNQACLDLFGAEKADELVGKSIFDLIHSDSRDEIIARLDKMRESGEPGPPIEHKLVRRDGQVVEAEVVAVPFKFGDENAIHVIIHDLTERVRAEKDREKLRSQLLQAQKMESIGLLAGGVAHDFNNLLAIIFGYGDLLGEELKNHKEGLRYLRAIMDAGHRAKDLVAQLLAFSRKQALVVKPVNVNHVLADFKKLLRRTIPENIELNICLSSDIPPVMADAGQLEQVVMNLAVNSVDAMPDGGVLTIETNMVTLDDEYSSGHLDMDPGSYIMTSVSDTGTGIDENTRSLIFDPFFSTKGKQGTGLGLATVYGIVKQHNGHIWVYSEQDRGSTFKIYLPAADGQTLQADEPFIPTYDTKGSETIVLVEDDSDMRRIVHIILEAQGYKVIVAANGNEALEKLAKNPQPVDLLLTDVIMPGMNGRELYNRCREKYPELKVLYMSGYTDNIIAHHGVLDSEVNFIQKPFSQKTLALKVRQVLDQ